ncbi:MAG TPA: hypothetical protein VD863_08335, partial [Bradyrhizobium sp.]|nr:hypothetical protein [Bradyrhizobium sp.]
AAAEFQAIGLARHGMAGGTSAGIERCEAVGRIRCISRQRIRSDDRGDRQPPENRAANGGDNNEAPENQTLQNSPQHSPIHRQWPNMAASMAGITALRCLKIEAVQAGPRE